MNFRLFALKSVAPALCFALFATGAYAQSPAFSKAFSPDTIGPGSTSKLTFVINNSSISPAEDLAFTDILPAGVTIANAVGAVSGCGGTVDAPGGSSTITFTDGVLGAGDSCEISVNVVSALIGTHTNTSGVLTSSLGNSGTATDDLTVAVDRPGFSKNFSDPTIGFGHRTTLTLTIDNSGNASAAHNLTFTDTLPSGIQIASPSNASTTCSGGILTAVPGSNVISYAPSFNSDASVAAGASCTVTVDVVGNAVGQFVNTSGELTSTTQFGGSLRSSGRASANLTVTNKPIVLTKTFANDPVAPGGTVDVEFTILGLSRADATNISFTDDLEAVLSGLAPVGQFPITNLCGGGSLNFVGGVLSFTGGSVTGTQGLLEEDSSCAFSITLQVPSAALPGDYTNTTSAITSDTATGDPASDVLAVRSTVLLTKSFTDDPVPAGGSVSLEFTITNPNSAAATGLTFTDELTTFLPFPISATLPDLPDGSCGAGSSISIISPGTDRQALLVTGVEVTENSSCTFSVGLDIPEGIASGAFENVTSAITGSLNSESITGNPATDVLVVLGGPSLTKEFTDDPVNPGDVVTLEYTLTHDQNATEDATGISFTDDLDAVISGMVATGLPQTDVCGVGSLLSGTSTITFSGGTLAPGESCTFIVQVQVPSTAGAGPHTNTTSSVTATVDGLVTSSPPATNDLLVGKLFLTKSFTDDPVTPGDPVTLEFTLTNDSTVEATNIQFSDNLSEVVSGLASTSGTLTDICGTGSQISGTSFLTFSGGTLAAGASCTFSVTLQTPANADPISFVNTTSGVGAVIDGVVFSGPGATDTLFLVEPEEEVIETVPEVTVEQAVAQLDPTSQQPVFFTAVFSEPVTGLLASEVAITFPGSAIPAVVITEVAPLDGTTYEISVSGVVGEGKVTASIPAGVADGVTYPGGTFFSNQASTSADNSVELTTERGDVTPPVITLNGSASVTVECPDLFVDPGASATDDIDGLIPITVSGDIVDTSQPGTYVITYDATDSSGNAAVPVTRTVTVVDTTPPVLTLNGSASLTLECGVDSYTELGATALDACEGEVSVSIGGDTVDAGTPGTYVVTYDASDSVPNAAPQVTRTVVVEDTTPPVITLNGEASLTLECGVDTYTELGATASDACEGALSVTIGGAAVDTGTPGTYIVTYDASDAFSNHAVQVIRTVTVADTRAPEITLVGEAEECVVQGEEYLDAGATVTDECDAGVTVSVGGDPVDVATIGTYIITYDAVDSSGNAATQVTRTVRVIPRFATVEGIFGSEKIQVKKSSVITGGLGEKTRHVLASQEDVTVEEDAAVDGNVVNVTGDVDLKKNVSVTGDATAGGSVDLDDGVTVGGTITENAVSPDILLPDLSLSAGGDDVSVSEDGSQSLAAGSYGKVELDKNATLTLSSAGVYHFEEFYTEEEASIVFVGPTIVNVEGKIEFKKGTQMSGADPSDILIQCDGGNVKLDSEEGDGSTYLGTFLAPNADVKLEKGGTLTGSLFGEKVTVEEASTVTGVIALDQIMAAAQDWTPLVLPLLRGPIAGPYEEWADVYGITDVAGDDDLDGLANALEYLLSYHPLRADVLVPDPEIDRVNDVITWSLPLRRPLDPSVVGMEAPVIEVSRDLMRWELPEAMGLLQRMEGDVLEVSGPRAEGNLYLRIGIEPSE